MEAVKPFCSCSCLDNTFITLNKEIIFVATCCFTRKTFCSFLVGNPSTGSVEGCNSYKMTCNKARGNMSDVEVRNKALGHDIL